MLLDQLVTILLRESARERERWLRAHAREWYRRLPRPSTPARSAARDGPRRRRPLVAPLQRYRVSH
jgi:hypothetical protein